MKYLLQNVSVDTVGAGVLADGSNKTLAVWATTGGSFGGGSVTINGSPDGGVTWITLTYNGSPAVFTSNIVLLADRLCTGMMFQAVLSGSSGASHVNAAIF
jgi:hypothetical protein